MALLDKLLRYVPHSNHSEVLTCWGGRCCAKAHGGKLNSLTGALSPGPAGQWRCCATLPVFQTEVSKQLFCQYGKFRDCVDLRPYRSTVMLVSQGNTEVVAPKIPYLVIYVSNINRGGGTRSPVSGRSRREFRPLETSPRQPNIFQLFDQ